MAKTETLPELPAQIQLALAYSRNFVAAKVNIGHYEKEHILGLCELLEKTAVELDRPAVQQRDEPVAYLNGVPLYTAPTPSAGQDVDALRAEIEKLKAALTPVPLPPTTHDWALPLESTIRNAQYWFDAGHFESDKAKAVMLIAQAMFAWKNACCSYAEKAHKLEAQLSQRQQEQGAVPDGYVLVKEAHIRNVANTLMRAGPGEQVAPYRAFVNGKFLLSLLDAATIKEKSNG